MPTNLEWFVFRLGLYFNSLLADVMGSSKKSTSEAKAMMGFSITDEYLHFPPLLRMFFESMTFTSSTYARTPEKVKMKKKNHILMVLSILCRTCDLTFLSQFDLSLAFFLYWVTGSKLALNVLSDLGVGVTYKTVKRRVESFSEQMPPSLSTLPPSDIVLWGR